MTTTSTSNPLGLGTVPAPFTGSAEERAANRATHHFGSEGRCLDCECRTFGRIADYPCGSGDDVPRIDAGDEGDYLQRAFVAHTLTTEES